MMQLWFMKEFGDSCNEADADADIKTVHEMKI